MAHYPSDSEVDAYASNEYGWEQDDGRDSDVWNTAKGELTEKDDNE
jgi:hypothetical protein